MLRLTSFHRSWRPVFAPVLFACLMLLTSACSSGQQATVDTTPDPNVVATYAGREITLGEFERRFERSARTQEAIEGDTLEAYRDFLERYVNFKLKVLAAHERGLHQDSTIQHELATYRMQLARPYLIEREVIDSLVADLYEKQKTEILASHILVLSDENAPPADTLAAYNKLAAVRDSILDGADFNAMAYRHSEDPSARSNAGHLPYFTGGRLVYEFEDMAYQTPVGEVSPIFRTQFGYHLMKVEDRMPYSPQVRASHILVSYTGRDSTQAHTLADSLLTLIRNGADFAELARQYSDDTNSGRQGGDLGFFARGRMVPAFENAAFAIDSVGQVTDLVETRFGFHIIKLTDREPLKPYDELYTSLKEQVKRMPRAAAGERQAGRDYRRSAGSSLNRQRLDSLITALDPDSAFSRLGAAAFDPDAGALVIGSVADSQYTFADFAEFTRTVRFRTPPTTLGQFHDLAERFLDQMAVDVAAGTLGERNEEFRTLMEEYRDGILLFAVSEDSIWNMATTDTVGLTALHEANRPSYTYPERIRVLGFHTQVDSVLAEIGQQLDNQVPVSQILASMDTRPDDFVLDTTMVADSTQSIFDSALGLEPGGRTLPLRLRGKKVILYHDGMEPARQKTFEEARAELVSDYQTILEEQWIARLRERYNARLYPEHLARAFAGGKSSSSDSVSTN